MTMLCFNWDYTTQYCCDLPRDDPSFWGNFKKIWLVPEIVLLSWDQQKNCFIKKIKSYFLHIPNMTPLVALRAGLPFLVRNEIIWPFFSCYLFRPTLPKSLQLWIFLFFKTINSQSYFRSNVKITGAAADAINISGLLV